MGNENSRSRYGSDPTWSSCPWVRTTAWRRSRLSRRYWKSGRTRSMPGMSLSGNDRPASINRMRSWNSRAAMFRPTSPTPPRKTSRGSPVRLDVIGGASLAAEGGYGTEARSGMHAARLSLAEVRIYTKKGDDGTTGLLYGGRVSKADPATEAYGSVDEAVAALGMVRALTDDPYVNEVILRLQRELFVVGADLATNPDDREKLKPGVSLATSEMVSRLEESIDDMVEVHPLPQEFIVPGASPVSAALDVARTAVRR